MTPVVLERLREAFLIGANDKEAYGYADISHETFYNYIEKHPEFREEIEKWKAAPILRAKRKVSDEIEKDTSTAKWLLERRAKKEYGANVDVTSDGDKLQPILVKFIGEEDAKDN